MFDSCKLSCMDEEWKRRFTEANERMRQASGRRSTCDPLVVLLYLLLRDVDCAGTLEQKLSEAVIACDRSQDDEDEGVVFTNGWLAAYAEDMAERLRTGGTKGEGEKAGGTKG